MAEKEVVVSEVRAFRTQSGEAPEGRVDADEAFEKLQPFKERVAEDIRSDDGS